jgi:lysophospholipase L1-like esterase
MPLFRTLTVALAVGAAILTLPAAAGAKPAKQLYVSLGDSYATGFQVTPEGGRNTRNGFAYQIPGLAKHRGYDLKLVNFGCGGETSTSLLMRVAVCRAPGPGGRDYAGTTQIHAAEAFLRKHRDRVKLITVSIGGNDVTACARAADPIACVGTAVQTIEKNVTEIAQRLRKAAGQKARIVGITYPDVILGQWVGENADQDLAKLSVVAFKQLINPTLTKAYEAAGGRLVDVTKKTGAYGPLDELVALPSGTMVPEPVAKVCELTYYCEFRDIHARTSGYRIIAKLVANTLPRR